MESEGQEGQSSSSPSLNIKDDIRSPGKTCHILQQDGTHGLEDPPTIISKESCAVDLTPLDLDKVRIALMPMPPKADHEEDKCEQSQHTPQHSPKSLKDFLSPASVGSPQHQPEQEHVKSGPVNVADGSVSASTSVSPIVVSFQPATVLQKIQKWGDYDSYGDVIEGTSIIPMKTPLTLELQKNYMPKDPNNPSRTFTVQTFLEDQQKLGRTVGLILDLSNHECLYTEDLPEGMEYKHVTFTAKHLPDPVNCRKVRDTISEFLGRRPESYVGIHCSYGYNRTGFVVGTYLIEAMGYTPQKALDAFAKSRAPGVKHENFREELYARYQHLVVPAADADAPSEMMIEAIMQVNYKETNNETLGELTGQMILEELEVLRQAEAKGGRNRTGSLLKRDCLIS